MKYSLIISAVFCCAHLFGQGSFAPAAGELGTTAMHKDSSVFVAWATTCNVIPGYQNIKKPSLGYASTGNGNAAIGMAGLDGTVSLGDGGMATLHFDNPIINGVGPDFAIFENSFSNSFLELAFVEVSSDGVNFFRFESVSETPTNKQVGGFDTLNASHLYNLAGKYKAMYGTPFYLEELDGIIGLDLNHITHIRLIDVVGSLDENYGTIDSKGNKINDPFPTPFAAGGFDLDAVGVIHQSVGIEDFSNEILLYPNPVNEVLFIESFYQENASVTFFSLSGNVLLSSNINKSIKSIDLSGFPSGIYFIQMVFFDKIITKKILIN